MGIVASKVCCWRLKPAQAGALCDARADPADEALLQATPAAVEPPREAVPACPVTGNTPAVEPKEGGVSGCPFAAIVKATAPAVAPKALEITTNFYERLFRQNPETKAFFNPANQFADPPRQRMALANAVCAYATNIEDLSPLTGAVEIIAHKHAGLSVLPAHYGIVHTNLMESIGEVLGAAVTPEVGSGWSEATLALAKILWEREEALYKMAESRSGGWRGVRDFKLTGRREVSTSCTEYTFAPADGTSVPIDFTPGQYLTMHLKAEGATPRHYTVTSPPGRGVLQCCVKRLPGGVVSNGLHQLKDGDLVGLSPPFGTFAMDPSSPAVLVSAGAGVTPMKALLQTSPSNVRLALHVDRNARAHPFKAEMEALAPQRTHFVYTEASGRPTAQVLVETVLKPYLAECTFHLCLPGAFQSEMQAALTSAGAKAVRVDVFGPALAAA